MQQRAGRSGCLGGLIYFAFVVSVSIILACVGWMAASDVLALNKEPVTATVTLDKAEFQDVTISYTDSEGNCQGACRPSGQRRLRGKAAQGRRHHQVQGPLPALLQRLARKDKDRSRHV